MKTNTLLSKLLSKAIILFFCFGSLFGQSVDITNDVEGLRSILDRTASLITLLPDFSDKNIISTIKGLLHDAEVKYQEALSHKRHGELAKARLAFAQVYAFLRQIENLIRQHPVLNTKFQEELDRKIQQAETLLRNTHNRDAINMLSLAKSYRQRAYSLFREGRTYAAMEFYGLAMRFSDQIIKIWGGNIDATDDRNWHLLFSDTRLLQERARNLINKTDGNRQAKSMLDKTENELKSVVRLYESKNYSAAKQKLLTVNRALYRIIDLLEKFPQKGTKRLEIEVESLELALQRIKEDLSNKDLLAAKKLYQRANNLLRRIKRNIRNKKPLLVRRNLFLANQLVLKISRMLQTDTVKEPHEMEIQIIRAKNELADLKKNPLKSMSMENFLDLIEDNLQKSELAYNQKEYLQSSYYLNMANRLTLRFNRFQLQQSQMEFQKEEVVQNLQRLSTLLVRLKSSAGKNAAFGVYYQNAEELSQLANQAFERNEFYLSKSLANMAINLITK